MAEQMTAEKAAALRKEFGAEHVGKLPKITCPACSKAPGRSCNDHKKSKCKECGNYITERHTHLDYVGHGAVTHRLLEVDPCWDWEPLQFDPANGMPVFLYDDRMNPVGLWVKLTVCGVTRLGFGSCPSNQGDAEKVLIGDALRNAAMRFGVALDLWVKGHAEDSEQNAAGSTAPDRRRSDQVQRRQGAPVDDEPSPRGEPAPTITAAAVAKAAEAAFDSWYEAAPKGHKTYVRDRLRHALTYAATKGRTASMKGCTPKELANIQVRLVAIAEGTMRVTAEPLDPRAGVTFATDGGEKTVLWAEVAECRGEPLFEKVEQAPAEQGELVGQGTS